MRACTAPGCFGFHSESSFAFEFTAEIAIENEMWLSRFFAESCAIPAFVTANYVDNELYHVAHAVALP